MFKILKQSKKTSARRGVLKTKHGEIQTPFFMPIATKGSVKALTSEDMRKLDAQILLSNTYHLYLQPGLKVLQKFKGLHNFMNWPGPILTDSGGYQAFSLSKRKRPDPDAKSGEGSRGLEKSLVKFNSKGVEFKSFLDGSKHLFTPEKVLDIQKIIKSDIQMVLDVCSPYPCSKKQAEKDLKLTHAWAERSLKHRKQKNTLRHKGAWQTENKSLLFGIVQGSVYKDLRLESVKFLSKLNFDGLAIGGLAVGESHEKMLQVLKWIMPEMPKNKLRYLMGVGKPEEIVQTVNLGMDMFDCVIPTREARHGRLYKFKNKNLKNQNFYEVININNAKYKNSTQSVDKNCKCELCQNYSLGYLQHLFKAQEPLALRLATLHNLNFYLKLMEEIRGFIK